MKMKLPIPVLTIEPTQLNKLFQNVMLIVALALGFFIGYYSYFIQNTFLSKAVNPFKNVKSINQVSVAVNDERNILIITKSSGEYQLYSDSVGMMIFKLYAARIRSGNESITNE